jgi:hypothetical protein
MYSVYSTYPSFLLLGSERCVTNAATDESKNLTVFAIIIK